jgi:hypothetical protein
MVRKQAFARTVETGPLGKLDDSIKEFRISSLTKTKLQQLATERNIDLTTFVRAMCDERAHGVDALVKLTRERYLAVSGKSLECPEAEK